MIYFGVGVRSQGSGVRGQEFELEFRVGEWWGVFSHKEQEKQEVSGVGVQSWSCRAKLAARAGCVFGI